MASIQSDLFAEDAIERNQLSAAERTELHARLERQVADLEAATAFPWGDQLDAIHDEKRFRRESAALGEPEGQVLWARFDRELDRLYELSNTEA